VPVDGANASPLTVSKPPWLLCTPVKMVLYAAELMLAAFAFPL